MVAAQELTLLGAGGNCREILRAIDAINAASDSDVFRCRGILDDNEALWSSEVRGIRVEGPLAAAEERPGCFVNAIGSPQSFWRKESIIAASGVSADRFAVVVHPSAVVAKETVLGPGSVLLENVTVGADVSIGQQVLVLANSVLSHDDIIGDYTCIASSACLSGEVRVGKSCYLGAASAYLDGVRVGNYALVGLGSVVIRDVEAETVVAGNPARYLKPLRRD